MKINGLYLVTNEECSNGRTTIEVVEAALNAGVDVVQMREKDMERDDQAELAARLAVMCRKKGVTFIVNDNPHITKESGADGVHLGQEDKEKYPINAVRKLLGNRKLIGLSTHSLEEVKEANALDVDYIGFGPVFKTKTKNYYIGTKDVKEAVRLSKHPVVFIGGVNVDNIDVLLKEGAKCVGVIRAVTMSENVGTAVKKLKNSIKRHNENKN